MIEKVIIWMIVLPTILFGFIFAIDIFTPFYIRSEFDGICYEYNEILIRDGELSSTEAAEFRSRLNEKNITIQRLDFPIRKEWGDPFIFEVRAQYSQSVLSPNLTRKIRILPLNYIKKRGSSLRGGD